MFIRVSGDANHDFTMPEYAGTILHVDLAKGTTEEVPLNEEIYRTFLGGRGLGVFTIIQTVPPTTDPLAPSNVLVIATGPLTGSGIPLGCRYDVVTKSPLTGTLSSANSGGFFGTELKRAGIDAIILNGAAPEPVYLWIHNKEVEVRDAHPYWGMTTSFCTRSLLGDLNEPSARVACIGPAGENLCRFASIMNESSRAAGRGGVGAVMGAKRLKAIVVRGDGGRKRAPREVVEMAQGAIEKSGFTRGSLHRFGTSAVMNIINEAHLLPTRNFQEQYFPTADRVSGEEMARTILKRGKGCYSCPVACGRVTAVDGLEGEGPEYESIWALGPDCGIDDLKLIARANYLCNDLGLDTISTGSTIACAMEMSERGLIRDHLRFGDGERLLDLIRAIAWRDGIGDRLAEGSLRFSLHHGHPEFSMTVKGQEIPAYDPRGLQGQGLEYATSVRGACHVYGNMVYPEILGIPVKLNPLTNENKAYWVKRLQDLSAAIDSMGICLFTMRVFSPSDYAAIVSGVTGIPFDERSLLELGERIWNLQRLFNLRSGLSVGDDTLPARLMGGENGWRKHPLLEEYYTARGWDKEGRPGPEIIHTLGIREQWFL